MQLLLLVVFILMNLTAFTTAQVNHTDAFTLLHQLANPNGELGWSENAQGVSLPDSEAIRHQLSASQEEEIFQQTVKRIDTSAVQGVSFTPTTQDNTTNTSATPSATQDPQVSQWTDIISQLVPHNV